MSFRSPYIEIATTILKFFFFPVTWPKENKSYPSLRNITEKIWRRSQLQPNVRRLVAIARIPSTGVTSDTWVTSDKNVMQYFKANNLNHILIHRHNRLFIKWKVEGLIQFERYPAQRNTLSYLFGSCCKNVIDRKIPTRFLLIISSNFANSHGWYNTDCNAKTHAGIFTWNLYVHAHLIWR